MQLKISLKWSLPIIGVVGAGACLIIIFFLNLDVPALGSFTYTAKPIRTSGIPIRIKIPKINVNALVESVGLTPQGDVDVPTGHGNAGWFNLSPPPGNKGSAVIDGHFGWWKNGAQAVFDNLYKLQKGDKLYVEDEKGATTTFVVRESRRFEAESDTSEVFASGDDKAHLNLITCDGAWDSVLNSYPNRLIVFADKETEQITVR